MTPTIGVANGIKSCDQVVFISLAIYDHMHAGSVSQLYMYTLTCTAKAISSPFTNCI